MKSDDLLREKLEVLDGTRGGAVAIRKAAVRIEDLTGLLELPPKPRSAKAAGSNPTKAEFDALVEDVRDLHNRLRAVADVLGVRVRR